MKKILLLSVGLLIANVYGQRECGTTEKMNEFFAKNPQALAKKQDLRNYLMSKNTTGKNVQTVITIPIVVHVLYKTTAQNISEAQIASQIAILNNDFRKLNADFNTVVPDAFKPAGADMELAFCMATKDPNGNPTTGIERKSVPTSFDFENNYYVASGLTAWDPTKYLNIWVGDVPSPSLGWAYLPDAAGYPEDGLAIGYKYFGTTGAAQFPYNGGRTATHEIGHYFGLLHPWGEDDSVCGTADNDDGCADTPATNNPYSGGNVFPDNSNMCTPSANGAMFMNFMDYVTDTEMALFSNDQKTIKTNTMSGPRASLLNSNGCAFLAVNEVEKANSINLFPNPTTQYISIASPLARINEVEIFNSEGRLVKKAVIKNETDKIDVNDLASGVYYVRTYNDKDFVKSMKFIKK
ncbi:T9SS type A sorting domain-containing protein [Chryseobacterium sp. RP-3-3]|uniref:T9SS type A sorting domain-containing protein n=1 Tax=Chryseobacterium antibioticum TaxID=2728847 RepID=A0A7Y0AS07_9FLAO|nr:T9SS type A sorting domain-containing protein [Chryseobacterium antibioticum]NML72397.1 T9SS type A sorting domain-containing protein [Chryseobacterium antibioticum]